MRARFWLPTLMNFAVSSAGNSSPHFDSQYCPLDKSCNYTCCCFLSRMQNYSFLFLIAKPFFVYEGFSIFWAVFASLAPRFHVGSWLYTSVCVSQACFHKTHFRCKDYLWTGSLLSHGLFFSAWTEHVSKILVAIPGKESSPSIWEAITRI